MEDSKMDLGKWYQNMMDSVSLINPTNNEKVDKILQGIIGIFERAFPNRVRGYYLTGSYSNGTAVSTSDVDFCPLFKNGFIDSQEQEKVWQLGWLCSDFISPIEMQVAPLDERNPEETYSPTFKIGSLLVYGEDIRDKLSLPLHYAKTYVI
jgi:hypothetical protein